MAFVSSLKIAVMRGWRELLQFFKRKPPSKNAKADYRNLYHVLRSYYDLDLNVDSIGRIRNCCRRVVEFYPAHLFPGQDLEEALPIDTSKMDEDFLDAVKEKRRKQKEQEALEGADGENGLDGNGQVRPPEPPIPVAQGTGNALNSGRLSVPPRADTTQVPRTPGGLNGAPPGVPGVPSFGPPPKSPEELEREREEEINPKSERLKEAIYQVMRWSNFADRKQVYARRLARDGDVFLKSAIKTVKVEKPPPEKTLPVLNDAAEPLEEEPDQPDNPMTTEEAKSVYLQLVDPLYVTDFDTDERGYLIFIRIDTPQAKGAGGYPKAHTHTEIWSKEDGNVRVWRHEKKPDEDVDKLPDPVSETDLEKIGIDFVPIVHAKFQDSGEKRGIGAFAPFLDKIDELNRMVSRRHEMFFRYNRPVWALQGIGNDASGRPIAPPRIDPSAYTAGASVDEYSLSSDTGSDGFVIELGTDKMVKTPGNTELKALIPDVDWTAADESESRLQAELEADMPELAMNRIRREMTTELSGRSVKFQLSDAIDKALEARGNAESALARSLQHCLTLAQENGLEGFSAGEIGTFDAGDFEFAFKEREVLPLNEDEEAEGEVKKLKAVTDARSLGGEKLATEVGHKFGYDSIEFNNNPVAPFPGSPANLARSQAIMSAVGSGATPNKEKPPSPSNPKQPPGTRTSPPRA